MNFFDIVFAIIIIGFALLSFTRGSLRELLSTLGIVLGYFGAEKYHERYMEIALQYLPDFQQAKIVTYLTLFAAGVLAGIILSTIIRILLVASQRPAFPSRILGMMLGLLKGILICQAIYFVVDGNIPSYTDDLYNSFFTPWLLEFKNALNGINFAFMN